jgi:serine/threonine-protein kinase HipA
MITNEKSAFVYVRNVFAGILKETDEGYSFKYDDEYLNNESSTPVSLTLPLRKEEFKSKVLFSFFDGLIPEGYLFDVAIKNWKLNYNDRFEVLLLTSKDTIGNVTLKEYKS